MIHPLAFGFGVSHSSPEPTDHRVYLWRGEEIVARLEVTPKLRAQLRASLRFDPSERETVLGFGGPLGSLYLGIQACPLKGWRNDREVSFALLRDEDSPMLDIILMTCLWLNPDEGSSTEPRWRRSFVHIVDELLGKPVHDRNEIDRREVDIPFPEGPCRALVTIEKVTFRRPRSPYSVTRFYGRIVPQKAPTVPGKGENSWDCDDDALFEMSCWASSVEEAATKFLQSVLYDRQRRAGSWSYPKAAELQAYRFVERVDLVHEGVGVVLQLVDDRGLVGRGLLPLLRIRTKPGQGSRQVVASLGAGRNGHRSLASESTAATKAGRAVASSPSASARASACASWLL